MRLQAKKTIYLREKVLGGSKPLICVPLVAEEEKNLKKEAKSIIRLFPDVIEWRADFFEEVCDIEKVKNALKMLRCIIKETPLIFTFRSNLEGGFKEVEPTIRYEIIEQVISTKEIDAVDIELISDKTNIEKIKIAADKHNVSLILSYHNFKETPSVEFLVDKMKQQILSGANIAKIAVMPINEEDVLNLLSATLKVRREIPDIPLITMSMGELGVISRIAGGLFGSDLTFGSGEKTSAPGQIPVGELRTNMKTLYK